MKFFSPFRPAIGLSTLAMLWALSSLGAQAQLSINATFEDGAGEAWDSISRGVVEQAIADWEAVLGSANPGSNDQIDITFDFTSAGSGGYLGQWQGSSSGLFAGDNRLPWENTTHLIHFNADKLDTGREFYGWWDPTPGDYSDRIGNTWDLLSVARHELGHALGFTTFYAYDLANPGELYPWEALITDDGGESYFDFGGLDAQMASASNLGHLGNTGGSLDALMTSSIPNGTRRDISQLEIDMLTMAYGYGTVPEPSALLLAGLGALGLLRRRR